MPYAISAPALADFPPSLGQSRGVLTLLLLVIPDCGTLQQLQVVFLSYICLQPPKAQLVLCSKIPSPLQTQMWQKHRTGTLPQRGQLKVLSTSPGFQEGRSWCLLLPQGREEGALAVTRRGFSIFCCTHLVHRGCVTGVRPADPSLGTTKLSFCLGVLMSSPAEGCDEQCPCGTEQPLQDTRGQGADGMRVCRGGGSGASRPGRAMRVGPRAGEDWAECSHHQTLRCPPGEGDRGREGMAAYIVAVVVEVSPGSAI